MMMGKPVLSMLLASLVLAACGGTAGAPSRSGQPALATTTGAAEAGGWQVTVTRGPDPGVLRVVLTAGGPLTVRGGCVVALTAWTEGATGRRVAPTPTPAVAQCGAITLIRLEPGQRRSFETSVPVPPASGTYTVHGRLAVEPGGPAAENIPVVTIHI
jgi:hypothetical protein